MITFCVDCGDPAPVSTQSEDPYLCSTCLRLRDVFHRARVARRTEVLMATENVTQEVAERRARLELGEKPE